MPKLFEYLGYIFFFYSNEHPPIHCHVKKGDKEVKVALQFDGGTLIGVSVKMANRRTQKLTPAEREKIKRFVEANYKEIRQKWQDLVAGKRIRSRKITKEIK